MPRFEAPALHETGPPLLGDPIDAPIWNRPSADLCTIQVRFGVSAKGDRWTARSPGSYRGRMSLATVHSRALDGLAAAPVTVEVHLANGLPSFTVVGLADTEVKEARERVRAALDNSGLSFPANKRI